MEFFAYINNFWEKTTSFNSLKSSNTHFMAIRMASFHKDSFFISSELNKLSKLPEWAKAAVLFYGLPKRNATRKAIPKKTIEKITKQEKKRLEIISNKYNCSQFHAKQILTIWENENMTDSIFGD